MFAGGKPPTAKLAGLTAVGLTSAFIVLGGLIGIAFLVKSLFF